MLNSAFFISQCSLVIYIVQNFLIDDILILIIKNVVKPVMDDQCGSQWQLTVNVLS